MRQGIWCTEPDRAVDAAFAFVPTEEWSKVVDRTRPLPTARFADRLGPVPGELLFFNGVAGRERRIPQVVGCRADRLRLLFAGGGGQRRRARLRGHMGVRRHDVTSGTDAGVAALKFPGVGSQPVWGLCLAGTTASGQNQTLRNVRSLVAIEGKADVHSDAHRGPISAGLRQLHRGDRPLAIVAPD